jgi:hypothetical protein
LKIVLIIIGVIIKDQIDNSSTLKYIKDEFSKAKGIKLYSIFKIIEYVLLLSKKFSFDLDLQLLKIIKAKKYKHKIISFVILCSFIYVNIYIIILFYYCTWLIINDNNKSFIPIYLKVNYIEFKQSNKTFKSIHQFISNDIHDRFLNYFVLFFVFVNGVIDKNIYIDNNNIYLNKIVFCFIAEFISDYLKGIILFKIGSINPKNIKMFLNEEIIYYNKIDIKDNKYFFLENSKLYESSLNIIDKENIFPMILNINIYPFYVIFLHYFFIKIKIYHLYKFTLFIAFIILKYLNEKIIGLFNISKLEEKNVFIKGILNEKGNNKIKNE